MKSIVIISLAIAFIYFVFRNRQKTQNRPSLSSTKESNTSLPDVSAYTSLEYWDQCKSALKNGNIEKATSLAFKARQREAKDKGYEFTESSSFGNPLFVKNYVEQLKQLEIPIQDVPDDVITNFRVELMLGTLKGENVKDTERRTRDIIDDFKWPEFDDWCIKYKTAGDWPPLWDVIADYTYLQEASIDVLLQELTKQQLLSLSKEYAVQVKKSAKKDELINVIAPSIPENQKRNILDIVNLKWKPRYLRKKRFLLLHTVSFRSTSKERIDDKYSKDKFIRISSTPDSCTFCKSKAVEKLKVSGIKKDDIPPFHPGCRCLVIPTR